MGTYCPLGSFQPTPCPTGSFSNAIGNKNESDCKPCSAGMYCDPTDLIVMERPCHAGFWCIKGKNIVIGLKKVYNQYAFCLYFFMFFFCFAYSQNLTFSDKVLS